MRQSCNNLFQGLTIQKSRHHGVFMAQTFVGAEGGLRPCPGSECAGNTFDNLLVSHSGGNGFLVNDVTCTNNVLCGARFSDDALGDLSQAAPNLVSIRVPELATDSKRLEAIPAVHSLADHIAAVQNTPKAL